MTKANLTLFAATTLMAITPAFAQPEQPSAGDLVDGPALGTFRGWTKQGGGIQQLQNREANYLFFERNGVRLLAVTRVMTRGAKGGVDIEKIVRIIRIPHLVGSQEVSSCSFLGIEPIVAWFNPVTKTATGIFYNYTSELEDGKFETWRWDVDDQEYCQLGGDD